MAAHAEELSQLESANVGKPIAVARDEIPFVVDNLRFFAGNIFHGAMFLDQRSDRDRCPSDAD